MTQSTPLNFVRWSAWCCCVLAVTRRYVHSKIVCGRHDRCWTQNDNHVCLGFVESRRLVISIVGANRFGSSLRHSSVSTVLHDNLNLRTTKICHTWNTSHDCRSEAAQVQPSWSGRSGKRYGAVALRPFARRQHENRIAVNSNFKWSIALDGSTCFAVFLRSAVQNVRHHGIRCWRWRSHYGGEGVPQVPREMRLLRSKQRVNTSQHVLRDIFWDWNSSRSVVLITWSGLFRYCPWVHIDNFASQAVLIKVSSSVLSGDIIADITWTRIVKLRMSPMVWARRNQDQSCWLIGPSTNAKSFVAYRESLESCYVVWSPIIVNHLMECSQTSAWYSRTIVGRRVLLAATISVSVQSSRCKRERERDIAPHVRQSETVYANHISFLLLHSSRI